MNPRLKVHTGELAGTEYEVPLTKEAGGMVLGRSRTCDIPIPDRKLSRRHCRFTFDGQRLFVEDLESKNGTQVNGPSIHGVTELHDGDRVEAGSTVLLVAYPKPQVSQPDTITATLPHEGARETAAEREGPPEGDFGTFKLGEKIYEGRSCIIYRARDREQRDVALKIVRPKARAAADLVERFQRGGKLATKLSHANLVRVFEAGIQEDAPFHSMEYVEGGNLQDLLRQRQQPMQPEQALKVVRQMLAGLQHVHQHRLVMRSVRPDNVLVTSALEAKLADYDLLKARRSGQGEDVTTAETVGPFDDAGFAAPELIARPLVVDERCDLFGVGACLYFMLTLSPPFPAEQVELTPHRAFRRALRQPEELNPDIPPPLGDIIRRSMSEYLDKRYQTAREMLAAVNRV